MHIFFAGKKIVHLLLFFYWSLENIEPSRLWVLCRALADLYDHTSYKHSVTQWQDISINYHSTQQRHSSSLRTTAAKAVGSCSFPFTEHCKWMTRPGGRSPAPSFWFRQQTWGKDPWSAVTAGMGGMRGSQCIYNILHPIYGCNMLRGELLL